MAPPTDFTQVDFTQEDLDDFPEGSSVPWRFHYGVEGHTYEPDSQGSGESAAPVNKRVFWFVRHPNGSGGSLRAELDLMRTWDIKDSSSSEDDLSKLRAEGLKVKLLRCANSTVPEAAGLKCEVALGCDLMPVPAEQFVKRTGAGGQQWWELKYKVILEVSDDYLAISMQCGEVECGGTYDTIDD